MNKINTLRLDEGVHNVQLLSQPLHINEEWRDGAYHYTGCQRYDKPGRYWYFAANLDGFETPEGTKVEYYNGLLKATYVLHKMMEKAYEIYSPDANCYLDETIGYTFEITVRRSSRGIKLYDVKCTGLEPVHLTKKYKDLNPNDNVYDYLVRTDQLVLDAVNAEYETKLFK